MVARRRLVLRFASRLAALLHCQDRSLFRSLGSFGGTNGLLFFFFARQLSKRHRVAQSLNKRSSSACFAAFFCSNSEKRITTEALGFEEFDGAFTIMEILILLELLPQPDLRLAHRSALCAKVTELKK
jgi:hypothetical protein